VPRPPTATSSETAKDIQALFVGAIREVGGDREYQRHVRRLSRLRDHGLVTETVLADIAGMMARIHEGSRKSVAAPSEFPPHWRGDWDADVLGFLLNCSVLTSRVRRGQSRPQEAAVVLLDFLPLFRFWSESGSDEVRQQAMDSLPVLLEELRDLVSTDPLPPESLRQIEVEAGLCEQTLHFPHGDQERRLARWSETLPTSDLQDVTRYEAVSFRWRYLLPERLMRADAFEFCERHAHGFRDCGGESFLELRSRIENEWAEAERSGNPIIRYFTGSLFNQSTGWEAFAIQARLRLLRCAARYRVSGELLDLGDPFGTKIRHDGSGPRMKFWSLGPDGRDDGGDPAHAVPWPDGRFISDAEGDVVIEVDKPK
jgi:hypothetical protein